MPLTRKQKKMRALIRKQDLKRMGIYPYMLKKPGGKRCLKCEASLICTAQHVPRRIVRCKRCNIRRAAFHDNGLSLDGLTGLVAEATCVIVGVEKCPDRKSKLEPDCMSCRSPVHLTAQPLGV